MVDLWGNQKSSIKINPLFQGLRPRFLKIIIMNQEIKKRWVEALRGGEYTQGFNQLKAGSNFCCLGVLCDLHAKETNHNWDSDSIYLGGTGIYLPSTVKTWAGLESINPAILVNNDRNYLANLNDEEEISFPELANLIEEQL